MTDTEIKEWLAEHVDGWLLRGQCPCIRYIEERQVNWIACLPCSACEPTHNADLSDGQCIHCDGKSYIYAQPENGLSEVIRALGLWISIWEASDAAWVDIGRNEKRLSIVNPIEGKTGDEAIRLALYRALTANLPLVTL
jgi:hypothetical protein